jgi:hypothetical protein
MPLLFLVILATLARHALTFPAMAGLLSVVLLITLVLHGLQPQRLRPVYFAQLLSAFIVVLSYFVTIYFMKLTYDAAFYTQGVRPEAGGAVVLVLNALVLIALVILAIRWGCCWCWWCWWWWCVPAAVSGGACLLLSVVVRACCCLWWCVPAAVCGGVCLLLSVVVRA